MIRTAHVFMLFAIALVAFGLTSSANARDVIYYTQEATHSIMCCELDGSNPRLVLDTGSNVRGLDVNPSTGRMYWAENDTGRIRSAKLNGTDITTIATGLNTIADLTLDVANGYVYTAQWSNGLISRVPMAGGSATSVINTNGGNPYGIVYNSGKLYWADWNYQHDYIQSANVNGSGQTTLANTPGPQTLTVSGNWVYFGDVNNDTIMKVQIDGIGLALFASAVNPWGMVAADGKLFWASQNESLNVEVGGSLQCASLDGGPVQTLLVDNVRPWDIAIVDTNMVPEPASIAILLFGGTFVLRRKGRQLV